MPKMKPNTNPNNTANRMELKLFQARAVAMIMPSTSPSPQPLRLLRPPVQSHVPKQRLGVIQLRPLRNDQFPTELGNANQGVSGAQASLRKRALIATTTVLRLIRTAPAAGMSRTPAQASTPAANGIATML